MENIRKAPGSFLLAAGAICLVCIAAKALIPTDNTQANFANRLMPTAGLNSHLSPASFRSVSTLQGTAALSRVNQFGSGAIQTSGLTPMDNGQIVYDANPNQQVYWLANANLAGDPTIRTQMGVAGINPNGTMDFSTAQLWVHALNLANNGSGYLGHTNWQLPATPPIDSTCSVLSGNNGNSFAADCSGSALGNLFYDGLALNFPNSVDPGFTDTIGPFQNLQPSRKAAVVNRPSHSLRI